MVVPQQQQQQQQQPQPPQAAVFVQGQEPLTASMLAQAPPSEQKQMLGERLFPLIQGLFPDMAGKITGMLLEIDNSELVHMLEHKESLSSKVRKFFNFLIVNTVESRLKKDRFKKDFGQSQNLS